MALLPVHHTETQVRRAYLNVAGDVGVEVRIASRILVSHSSHANLQPFLELGEATPRVIYLNVELVALRCLLSLFVCIVAL